MALAQQGKPIDGKLLDNYANRGIEYETKIEEGCRFICILELPTPTFDTIDKLEYRLSNLLQNDRRKSTNYFRYDDLCSLDTIHVEIAPEKKGNK